MTIIRRALSESITHVEDLPLDEFIGALKKLPQMVAQEKLDGANLWVGLDENGKLFTSREGKRKNADRRFKPEDWPLVSAFNQFRAAHAAIAVKEQELKQVLRPGDTVEAEVMFGRQPNSVIYGADGMSFIAFLRGVNGTADSVANELAAKLMNQTVDASTVLVDTADGEQLSEVQDSFSFKFTAPHKIDSQHLKAESHISGLVAKLESFLDQDSGAGMTNRELASVNLQKIDKSSRDEVKQKRTELLAKIQTEFKLPIKNALLDKVVRKIRSGLTDKTIDDKDDIGIEGIVLRDPESGNQIKIVDKDVFTAINKFNQHVRQSVQSALNTLDPDASLEARGGLIGEMRIRIAEVFGNRELAKASNARKAFSATKGNTPEETVKNFADTMQGIDDFIALKKKILAIIADTSKQLKQKLEDFKDHQDEYRLKLKNGKEIGLSPDTVKRTLLTFAEARKHLIETFERVKKTKSLAQLVATLYGQHAKALHQPEDLEESLVLEKKATFGDIDRSEYHGKDKFQILNAYLATVFMTMLIYHESDTIGMRILRDRKNMSLKRWSRDMSPLNHWGYVVWRNTKTDVKKDLPKKVQTDLFSSTRHIVHSWWKFLHMDFSYSKDVKVDWIDHRKTIQRLIDLAGLRSDRLNSLLDWMVRWPDLSHDEKVKAISKLYFYAMQFVPRSVLFNRVRVIQQNLLINATGTNTQMVIEASLLKSVVSLVEDDAKASSDPNQFAAATTSADISSAPHKIGNRVVIKRKRNPEVVKALAMKFPDTRKQK